MNQTINQVNFQTKDGNTLSVFFNAHNNLLVVDLVHANEKGGNEVIRKVLDEKAMLVHCEPAIEVAAAKVVEFAKAKTGCSKTNRKTPAQWCEKFGVQVLDPDGWDRTDPNCMSYPISQDMFIKCYQLSTCRIVDSDKFRKYQHLFG